MKLLIFSEGKSELGGALETLVCRTLGIPCHCDKRNIRDDDIGDRRVVGRWRGGGKRLFRKAIHCAMLAESIGYDAIILVVDQDHDKFKHRRDDLNEAQEHLQITQLKRAFGVAIQSFDAWMLADEVALATVLGIPIQRLQDPETIPNPKWQCMLLCKDAKWEKGLALTLYRIGRDTELEHS